jgi:hypothetical protein
MQIKAEACFVRDCYLTDKFNGMVFAVTSLSLCDGVNLCVNFGTVSTLCLL